MAEGDLAAGTACLSTGEVATWHDDEPAGRALGQTYSWLRRVERLPVLPAQLHRRPKSGDHWGQQTLPSKE